MTTFTKDERDELADLRRILRECVSVMELASNAPDGVTIGMHIQIERGKIALGLDPDKPIKERPENPQWTPEQIEAIKNKGDGVPAKINRVGRVSWRDIDTAAAQDEINRRWSARMVIEAEVTADEIRAKAAFVAAQKSIDEGWANIQEAVFGHKAPSFDAAVTDALGRHSAIDPNGDAQGMRVLTPEEREAERARMAEHFKRNGVL